MSQAEEVARNMQALGKISVRITADVTAAMAGLAKVQRAVERLAAPLRWRLVVDDPFDDPRPASVLEWVRQARDIVAHDFWMAADRPSRSPGARWERRGKR
jgi:CTP:molybdopterin cytidylyltransferase MocA